MENKFFLFKMGRDILIKNGTDFELKMVKKKSFKMERNILILNEKNFFFLEWERFIII